MFKAFTRWFLIVLNDSRTGVRTILDMIIFVWCKATKQPPTTKRCIKNDHAVQNGVQPPLNYAVRRSKGTLRGFLSGNQLKRSSNYKRIIKTNNT